MHLLVLPLSFFSYQVALVHSCFAGHFAQPLDGAPGSLPTNVDLTVSTLYTPFPPAACLRHPLLSAARLPRPYTTTLNLDTGKATRVRMVPPATNEGLDFPQLRRTLIGRKNR